MESLKDYMKLHIKQLVTRLVEAERDQDWQECIEFNARIFEAEHLYAEMLRRGLLEDVS